MSTSQSTTVAVRLEHPRAQAAFRAMSVLLGSYLALSVATLVVAASLHGDNHDVTSAVWIRAIIVAVSAVLTCAFARFAARGSRRAFLRLRIVSAIMLIAIAVIVALPGAFPMWFRIEQALCGLLIAGVVILANRRPIRTAFAR